MKASVEAQALIRKNFEEQSSALNDFKAWETKVKLHDANRKRNGRKKVITTRTYEDDFGNRIRDERSSDDNQTTTTNDDSTLEKTQILPPMLQKSTSIVVGGEDRNKNVLNASKNPVVPTPPSPTDSSNEYKHQKTKEELARDERERGNKLFAAGEFEGSIRNYSNSILYDSSSALAYSNRAMARLKLKDWYSAESDTTIAINLDPLHLKSYQRRSIARLALGKIKASLNDLYSAKAALKILNQQQKQQQQITTTTSLSQKEENRVKLPQDISTNRIETEFLKIIKNAPRRKVLVEIEKSSSNSPLKKDKKDDELKTAALPTKPASTKFSVAKNWLEFEQTWKKLKTSQLKTDLLSAVKAKKFIELYKNGMEDSGLLLDLVVHCAQVSNGFTLVKDLSCIPSIDMLPMMLSNKERKVFSDHIEATLKKSESKDDAVSIKRNFGL